MTENIEENKRKHNNCQLAVGLDLASRHPAYTTVSFKVNRPALFAVTGGTAHTLARSHANDR